MFVFYTAKTTLILPKIDVKYTVEWVMFICLSVNGMIKKKKKIHWILNMFNTFGFNEISPIPFGIPPIGKQYTYCPPRFIFFPTRKPLNMINL